MEETPTGEAIFDGLLACAVADLIAHYERKLSRADKSDGAAGVTQQQQLEHARQQADFARREIAQIEQEKKNLHTNYRDMRERYDTLRRSIGELDAPAPDRVPPAELVPTSGQLDAPHPDPSPKLQLPKGIRRRESGRFQALLYESEATDGRQKVIGTFDTLPDAVGAREGALREAARVEQAAAA